MVSTLNQNIHRSTECCGHSGMASSAAKVYTIFLNQFMRMNESDPKFVSSLHQRKKILEAMHNGIGHCGY